MIVTVNGQARELESGSTVAAVVALLEVPADARGVAVALDGVVVTRSRWTETELADGSLVEIVSAIQGG